MTRITDITLTRIRLRFRTPVRFGDVERTSQEVGVVQLHTDTGLVGLGEVAGPTLPADIEATLRQVRRALLDRDPADVEGVEGLLRGALDTALLDVMGRLEGRSMADLLGGGPGSVAVNALLVTSGSPARDAAAARALIDAGSRTIKIKPATSRASVRESLEAIRDALDPGVLLRLDLNGSMSEADAIAWLATLEGLELDYVEQPIAPSLGVAALARVRRSIPMPLAADESLTDSAAATALIDAAACDVLVVKPARVGGPRPSVHIAREAAAAGVAVTISTLYESGIGLAAALHVAATIPGQRAHGLGTGDLLETDLIGGDLPVVRGRLTLPSGGGLGVALDLAALSRSLVPA